MGRTSSSSETRTLVLVGRTGNGKSATGNTILGRRAFKSRVSASGVTSTCELQSTVPRDGKIINVIDTPGLFAGPEFVGKEIVKCIDMAKDGIHAVLTVFSVKTRFSQEEENALRSLQTLFGEKIVDYMIVVFTGGDELEDNEETLDDYLGRECPEPLKEIMARCGNRIVLFDNKTKDERKRSGQVQELLSLVDKVISQNGGQPYTNEIFQQVKERAEKLESEKRQIESSRVNSLAEIRELRKEMQKKYEDELKQITEMVDSKLKEETRSLHRQLAREQAARLRAEEDVMSLQIKAENDIQTLRRDIERANRRISEQENKSICAIL